VNAAREGFGLPALVALCSGTRFCGTHDAFVLSMASIFESATYSILTFGINLSPKKRRELARFFDRKAPRNGDISTPPDVALFLEAFDAGYYPQLEL
jgi:hypothetical protein